MQFRSSTNTLFTRGLFYETTLADKSTVIYTLKDSDHHVPQADGSVIVYPSLYLKYLEANDPTEYRFATTYLDGWYHWEMLRECTWFKDYLSRWRRELSLRMQSEALVRIMREAKTSSKDSFTANRYLLEKAWEPKEAKGHGRGRPSKDEIKQAASEALQVQNRLTTDFDRILSLGTKA